MARRRRRKKNPSGAQIAVLTIGGLAGAGLIGYGIYRLTRPTAASDTPEGGLGLPGATYEYRVQRMPFGRPYWALVYLDGAMIRVFSAKTAEKASDKARKWIAAQMGAAVCLSGCPGRVTPSQVLPPI